MFYIIQEKFQELKKNSSDHLLGQTHLYFINVNQNGSVFDDFTFNVSIEPKKYVVD
ncbi:hypothetical protein ENUP19_0379G0005 [Entamoeba nuttalli]|uniref:Uncharacterized protein n=1 Tax=Entamoeba nuttalli TaxID=412467 RepID=A0ABQ0DZ84_9EUKA